MLVYQRAHVHCSQLMHRDALALRVHRRVHRSIPRKLSAPQALPEQGEESDALKADIERFRRLETQTQMPASSPQEPSSTSFSLKDAIDKVLIADFFLVLAILAWLGAGVVQAGLSGTESSPLLEAWYPLWPTLWQPALGVLMLGAIVSGALGWLENQAASKK